MKKLRSLRPPGPFALLLLLLFLIMLTLSCLTPMVADDYSYSFSWVDNARMRSLSQLVPSMAVHRQLTNGRVFTHGLVQLLLMFPKRVFDLLNGGAAVLLFWLFSSFCGQLSARQKALLTACGALLLWDLSPVFGQTFLWLDGAVNYGWGCCLFLLFLRPYAALWLRGEDARPLWRRLLFLLLAFVAGTWSESAAPATLLAACGLLLLARIRDRRRSWWLIAGLVLQFAGILFLISAPATLGRASSGFDLAALAGNLQDLLLKTRPFLLPVYLIYALTLVLALSCKAQRRTVILSGVLWASGLLSLLAYVFAAYITSRHFCFAMVVTCLAELLLLAELLRLGRPLLPRLLTAGALAAALFLFPLGVLDIGVTYKHSLEREAQIRQALEAGERELRLEMYVPSTGYSAPYQLEDLNPAAHAWPNCSLEDYYGLESIYGVLPEGAEEP